MDFKKAAAKDGDDVATPSNPPITNEESTPESSAILSTLLSSAGKLLPTPRSKSELKEGATATPSKTRATKFEVPRSERMVRVVLKACHIPDDQVNLIITKGRVHSLRKVLMMTESYWT